MLAVLCALLAAAALTATSSLADAFAPALNRDALASNAPLARAAATIPAAAPGNPGRCVIHSLPSFTESGESLRGEFPGQIPSAITDIVEVECEPIYAGTPVEISSQELSERCHGIAWTEIDDPEGVEHFESITVPLDDDGNATVALLPSGPCAAGESLITADLLGPPNTTVVTSFTVLPPSPTEVGVYAIPPKAVEDDTTSSVATIIEVEFPPEFSEELVSIDLRQLYGKCRSPHIIFFPNARLGEGGRPRVEGEPGVTVRLDNDGTAFVLVLGTQSCSAGKVLVEASLEEAPYTTYSTEFEIEPPEPTLPEKEFTIEKLQKLPGGVFTKKPLVGKLGQTVEYEIIVHNTGGVPLPLSGLTDPDCENISAGPAELAAGKETTFTCTHTLTEVGTWTNVGTITAGEEKKESNKVEVKVPKPEFTIEKLQSLEAAGGFVKTPLKAMLGETVYYEIIVRNPGKEPEMLTPLTDEKCESPIEGSAGELAPGAKTIFTCMHKLTEVGTWTNVGTITGSGEEKKSNEVEVEVKRLEKPGFEIEKLQRLEGEAGYTTKQLTGHVGENVEYEIIVRNTGNVTLTFAPLKDEHCENITPSGPSEVPSGQKAVYTCSQKLTKAGTYTNVAVIEGNEGTGEKKSEKVEVVVPEKAFTIEKLERLNGSGSFSPGPLVGHLEETIEYEIIVKNTGTTKLQFSEFSDPVCEGLVEGHRELGPGESATYTCTHKITKAEKIVNVASIVGSETLGKKPSNEVVVNVPAYTIEKLQRLSGAGSFVTTPLKGKEGETVEYEIKVKNTGNLELSFSEFKDPNCEDIKAGSTNLGPGEEAVYTCIHKLASSGEWMNQASIVGNEGTGGKPSNVVLVTVEGHGKLPEPPKCKVPNANYVLLGAIGPKRNPFTVRITSKGIKKITFYLGAKKIKTLTGSQAKHGEFTLRVNPRKLSYGHHRLTIRAELLCGEHIARTSAFVRPKSNKEQPPFTG